VVIRLSAGRLRLAVLPELGGSVGRLDWIEGDRVHQVLRRGDAPSAPLEAGCFPLVPFCNRVRGGEFEFRGRVVRLPRNLPGEESPLHGQGWQRPWEVESAGIDRRHSPLPIRRGIGRGRTGPASPSHSMKAA
jgi:aldose 1-epimerase